SYSEEMLKNPETSLEIGCWYLNYLYEKTDSYKWALAAYNGGIANVEGWIKEGITPEQIPFPETNDYVKKIEDYRKIYKILYWKEFGR
ncbi:MAG: transglycosylase SLT domain-containing protein, partial [Oscillospiraceae bacterium]|nr:transglycosylase SLT domain-containing protein [Oscillospiraceae bacterium]